MFHRLERRGSLRDLAVLAEGIGAAVEVRSTQCSKVMLLLMLSISTALSLQGFFGGPLSGVDIDLDAAKWVYLGVGVVVGVSVPIYDRLRRLRTYVFAGSTMTFGVSFMVLSYQERVGGVILLATPLVVGLIRTFEFLHGRFSSARPSSDEVNL